MPERLIDVSNGFGTVLHTFPVVVDDCDALSDDVFCEKALKLAAHAQLVPADDVRTLTAKVHVARGGPLAPYGDDRHILEGTRQGLENVLRERAYFLWQNAGHPDGQDAEHWCRAFDQHLRERAYFVWLREGCPEGRAEEHWRLSREFETYPD
ncbi:MAG: DUF2934 domain-containing protein [Acetobacteraceae bacterium]